MNSKKIKPILFSLLLLLLLNFAGSIFFKRFDVTTDKRYTLSKVSKKIISKINQPALVTVYLKGDFPAEFERLQTETRQFLEELSATNSNIKFRLINPANIKELLIKKGMTPSQLTIEENGKLSQTIIFPWAEINYKNKSELVNLLPNTITKTQEEQLQNAVSNLEYSFANAFYKITQSKTKKIAVLSGNGELEDIKLYSFLKELTKKYRMGKFTLDSVGKNPQKTITKLKEYNLIIVAKPTEKFTTEEKITLDQFIMNGGKSLWMIDNIQADTDSLYNSGRMMAFPRNLNLTDLLFSYGVRINNKLIKDLYAAKLTLASGNVGNQTQFESFSWFYHPMANPNPKHSITKNILPVRMRFATQIDTLKNSIKKTPLLISSVFTKEIGTPTFIELQEIAANPVQKEFSEGNKIFAILLEGSFKSAYKDRTLPLDIQNFKKESKSNKMVVVSDGDIARNQILKGKPYDLAIDKWTQQRFGNKDFLLNTIDYLLDDSGLIELRNKSVKINLLNKKKAFKERYFWQFLNIIVPLSLLAFFGLGFNYYRKKKYS